MTSISCVAATELNWFENRDVTTWSRRNGTFEKIEMPRLIVNYDTDCGNDILILPILVFLYLLLRDKFLSWTSSSTLFLE